MLNALGGGKRYRAERFVPYQDRFRFSEEALRIRAAFSFDPQRVRSHVEQGWWRSDTLSGWLRRTARERPDGAALVDERGTVSFAELAAKVAAIAAGLHHHAGVRPGDVVAVQLPNVREHVEILLAVSALGKARLRPAHPPPTTRLGPVPAAPRRAQEQPRGRSTR